MTYFVPYHWFSVLQTNIGCVVLKALKRNVGDPRTRMVVSSVAHICNMYAYKCVCACVCVCVCVCVYVLRNSKCVKKDCTNKLHYKNVQHYVLLEHFLCRL